MRELWRYRTGKISNLAFDGERLAVSSGNRIFCFDLRGLAWAHRFRATFYRDPYSDVRVTAVAVDRNYIAAGTNFMDGKLYLFTVEGKKLWEQQFATIASLGWRPEDVTAIGLGDVVVAGAGFVNDYVYAFTPEHDRLFERRVEGTVRSVLCGDGITVGTDRELYLFSPDGDVLARDSIAVSKLEALDERIIAVTDSGVVVYTEGLERLWRFDAPNPKCRAGEGILVASKDNLTFLSEDGEILWTYNLSGITSLGCEDCIFAGVTGTIYEFSPSGELLERFEICGTPLEIRNGFVISASEDFTHLYAID